MPTWSKSVAAAPARVDSCQAPACNTLPIRAQRALRAAAIAIFRPALAACLALVLATAPALRAEVVPLDLDKLRSSAGKQTQAEVRSAHGNLLIVDMPGDYNRNLGSGDPNHEARVDVAHAVYTRLDDDYDFIVVAPAFPINLGDAIGLHWQVSNQVSGIGRPPLDGSFLFGSAGRLKGVIDLDESILGATAADSRMDALLDTLMHEVMHQWGVYLEVEAIAGDAATALKSSSSHWSAAYDSNASVMYGARWGAAPDLRLRALAVSDGFGPLDLYLAGFLAPTEVPETQFLLGTGLDPEHKVTIGQLVQATPTSVNIAQVIAAAGPRLPAHDVAQKRFRAALVVLARPGDSVDDNLLASLDLLRAQAALRFAAITQGRGQLQLGAGTALTRPERGQPSSINTDAGVAATLNLQLARQWIAAEQGSNGLWRDKAATELHDTRRAVTALSVDSTTHGAALASSADALATIAVHDVDRLASALLTNSLPQQRRSELVQALLTQRRPDGGWGLVKGFRSSTLDTALALLALQASEEIESGSLPEAVEAAAIDLLSTRFQPDPGCWAVAEAGACDFLSSSHALLALARAAGPDAVAAMAPSLFRWHQAGGGFAAQGAPTAMDTVLALEALQAAGLGGDPRAQQAHQFLVAGQRSNGSWDGSIAATGAAATWLAQLEFADLTVIGSIAVDPEGPIQGQRVLLTFDVANRGMLLAPVSALRVEFAPTPGGPWTALPEPTALPALAPGAVQRLTALWDTQGLAPGQYQLRVRVDADEEIEESNEANNTSERNVVLQPAPTLPDLAIDARGLQINPSTLTNVPQPIQVRADIANLGLTPVAAADVAIYGWRFGELRLLRTVQIEIGAQQRVLVDESVTIDDADISRIVVVLDPNNQIAEADENNNRAQQLLDAVPTIDLAVSASDLQIPDSVERGVAAEFRITLHNLGTRLSPVFQVRAEIERSDGSVVLLAAQQAQIEAGTSIVRSFTWTPDSEGASKLRVHMDPDNLVVEIREDNNQAERSFTVQTSTRPNLRIVPGSWQVTPSPGNQGAPASFSVEVANTAGLASPPVDLAFYWATRGSSNFRPLGTLRLNDGLPAGSTQRVAYQHAEVPFSGPVLMRARIDDAQEVPEGDESDNDSLYEYEARSLPNLQISGADALLVPSQPAPGSSAQLQMRVRNTGEQAAQQIEVELLLGSGAGAVSLAPMQTLPQLLPGTSADLVFEFTRPEGEHPDHIEVIADRANRIAETRKDDNSTRIPLQPIDPDFFLTEPYISPNGDGVKDQTTINVRFAQPTRARIRIIAPWGEEIARLGDDAIPQTAIAETWAGLRNDGRRALDDSYQVRVESHEGALLKIGSVVIDTNRSPLVRAASDGHARIEPFRCDFRFREASESLANLAGKGEIIAPGFTQRNGHGIYSVPFDGGEPTPLLLVASVPGASPYMSAWREESGANMYYSVESNGSLHFYRSHANGSQLQSLPIVVPEMTRGSQIGRLASGHEVLLQESPHRIVAVHMDTGDVRQLVDDENDLFLAPAVGVNSVLSVDPLSDSNDLRLHRLDGTQLVPYTLPSNWYPLHAELARPIYSPREQAYYLATGTVFANRYADAEVVIRISELDGSVQELRRAGTDRLANFVVSISPDGRYLAIIDGGRFEVEITDLESGERETLNLSELAPEFPEPEQYRPLSIGIFAALWSPDSRLLAVRVEGTASQIAEASKVQKFVQFCSECIEASASVLINIQSGVLQPLEDFTAEAWVDGELQLLGGNQGIAVERGLDVLPMRLDGEITSHFGGIANGRYLPVQGNGPTCPESAAKMFSSTANGVAQLEIQYEPLLSAYVLSGTVYDLNLERWVLEERRAGTSSWSEFATGSDSRDGGFLALWSPNSVGRHDLRLRTLDRAGNEMSAGQSVVSFSVPALASLRIEPRVFSPNGDGVKDLSVLTYRNRSPAAIALRVETNDGQILRQEFLIHSAPGSHQWAWDGRTATEEPVIDGSYRIVIDGRAFPVVVDRQLPGISAEIRRASQCDFFPIDTGWIQGAAVLAWDENLSDVTMQTRNTRQGNDWLDSEGVSVNVSVGGERRLLSFDRLLMPGAYELERRLIARDHAGNVSIGLLPPIPPVIGKGRFAGKDWVRGFDSKHVPIRSSGVRLAFAAGSPGGWQVRMQLSGPSFPSDWIDVPHNVLTDAEDRFDAGSSSGRCWSGGYDVVAINWPESEVNSGKFYLYREVNGEIETSNIIFFSRAKEPGGNPGPPPEEDGGSCPQIGGPEAQLPGVRSWTHIESKWADPRIGANILLPTRAPDGDSSGNSIIADITSMPGGVHIVESRWQRWTVVPPIEMQTRDVKSLVGRDLQAPLVEIEWPVPGARVCAVAPDFTAKVTEEFLQKVEVIGGKSPFKIVRVPHPLAGLGLIGSTDLRSISPAFVHGVMDRDASGRVSLEVRAEDCTWPRFTAYFEPRLDDRVDAGDAGYGVGSGVVRPVAFTAPPIFGRGGNISTTLGASAWFRLVAAEPVRVSLSIARIGLNPHLTAQGLIGAYELDGAVFHELASTGYEAGEIVRHWNGISDSGSLAPDGYYIASLTLIDECGNEKMWEFPFAIDNTPPDVAWPPALAGTEVNFVLDVLGEMLDVSPERMEVHWRVPGSAVWEPIGGAQRFLQPRQTALGGERGPVQILRNWVANVPSGTYQLRLRGWDTAGNTAEDIVEVTVVVRERLLRDVAVAPDLFSPNGDGVLDQSFIRSDLIRAASLFVEVLGADGSVLRTLADGSVQNGLHQQPWDGRDAAGVVVADGRYRARVRAVDPAAPEVSDEGILPVTVDTTAPVLRMLTPAAQFSNGRGPLLVEVVELHPGNLLSTTTPALPGLLRNTEEVGEVALATLDAAPEGSYELQLLAEDRVGNRASLSHSFVIDRTPPQVVWTAPAEGAVVSRVGGAIALAATVEDANLQSWELRLLSADLQPLRVLATQATAQSGPATANWDGVDPDGPYVLEWEGVDRAGNRGSARRALILDNTPPVARIDVPTAGAYVGLSFPLDGTASDANLVRWEVDIAAAGASPDWQRVAEGAQSIVDGNIAALLAPQPDGAYILRLRATDRADLVGEAFRDIRIDTEAPLPPLTLRAERVGTRSIQLNWTASASPDVQRYRIWRDGRALIDTADAQPQHLDAQLADGRYRYRVSALDRAGNESALSNEAVGLIDTTPPEVALHVPRGGERLRGEIPVSGRAYSREDFDRFELDAIRLDAGPGTPEPVSRGTSPILGGELGRFNSLHIDEGLVRMQLRAWDQSGNQASTAVEFFVDNLPPAPPQNLQAVLEGGGVRLTWDPNTESDLAGYLLYRGPILLQGSPAADPRTIVITAVQWLDLGVGDGDHEWRAVAVDTTGNVSDFSDPASLTRSGNPPRVILVRPLDGDSFDGQTLVRGLSADSDLEEVQFEVRGPSAGSWQPLGPPMTAPPWEQQLIPPDRAFGAYRLRAQSRDTEGLVDPNPPEITVHYRDLTAPPAPLELSVRIDGGNAHLLWSAVDASDLAHYRIERSSGGASFLAVADVPAGTLNTIDSELADGAYRYRVRAVDEADNASQPSPIVAATVFTPELAQPYTPSIEEQIVLRPRSALAGTMLLEHISPQGTAQLPEQAIGAGATLTLPLLVETGDHRFNLRVRYNGDHRSKLASVEIRRSQAPPAPHGLVADLQGHELQLDWQIAAHPSPLGFRVIHNGLPFAADTWLAPQTAQAVTVQAQPTVPLPELLDGDPATTAILPLHQGRTDLRQSLPAQQMLVGVEIDLSAAPSPMPQVVLQAWWRGVWVELPQSTELSELTLRIRPTLAYRSDRLRVLLSGLTEPLVASELRVGQRPVQSASTHQQTLPDGRHRYRVGAVNADGIEGPLSEPLDLDVGDTEPPEPVVLSGHVDGNTAHLQWTASTSPDLAAYWLMRGQTRIATITDLEQRQYADPNLPNAQYDYRVYAVDAVGNLSESNLVSLIVDIGALARPENLVVTAVPGGGALALTWQAGAGGIPATGFLVKRSLQAEGPFVVVAEVTPTQHLDTGLTNGTRYHYVVQARDLAGNTSADSDPASGVPYTDEPVATPVFHFPTRYGSSVTVPERSSVIAGKAQPGAMMRIAAQGQLLPAMPVPTQAQSRTMANGGDQFVYSPDGRHAFDVDNGVLRSLQPGVPVRPIASPCLRPSWRDAHHLLICEQLANGVAVRLLELPALRSSQIAQLYQLSFAQISRDGRRLVVGGRLNENDPEEVIAWRELTAGSPWVIIPGLAPGAVDLTSLALDPSGRYLLYRDYQEEHWLRVDLDAGLGAILPLQTENNVRPGFSPLASEALLAATGPAGPDVYRINLETAAITPLGLAGGPYVGAWLDPAGERLVVLAEAMGWYAFTWPALQFEDSQLRSDAWRLQGLETGEWLVQRDYGYGPVEIVLGAGRFRFDDVALAFGENIIAGIAQAPGQLDSIPALPITLIVPADGLPDLAVRDADISSLPNVGQPGVSLRIGARVRNIGSGAAPAAQVLMRLYAPDGQAYPPQQATLPPLAINQEHAVAWQTPALAESGIYAVRVEVDPQRLIAEGSTANNQAGRLLTVNADGMPEMQLQTDRSLLAPGETLGGYVDLIHGGASFQGQLRIRVLDDADHLVALLLTQAVSLNSPGASQRVPLQWLPGAIRAGHYRIQAELFAASGSPVRVRQAAVELRAFTQFHLALTPEQQTVTSGDAITLQARVRLLQANTQLDQAELRVNLLHPGGQIARTLNLPLPPMGPGFGANFPLQFDSNQLAAANYSVQAELWSTNLIAEAGATVQVQMGALAPAVQGQFLLPPQPHPAGTPLSIEFELRNSGGQPLLQLPVRARARYQAQTATLGQVDHTIDLAPGQTWRGTLALPAAALNPGSLVLSLSVPSGALAQVLDLRSLLVADLDPPLIVPMRPSPGAILPRSFVVEGRAQDAHSGIASVERRAGVGPWSPMTAGVDFSGQFLGAVQVAVDGPLELQLRASDLAGNSATSPTWSVVVDGTPPVITITGVQPDSLNAQALSPVITVVDLHLDVVQIVLNGQPYVSGTLIPDDGQYTLFVRATDLAGNQATQTLHFTIDRTPPPLAFVFPAEGAVIGAPDTPVRLASEALARVRLHLGAQSWERQADATGLVEFLAIPLQEGANLLRADARDEAGNLAPEVQRTVWRSTVTVGRVAGEILLPEQPREPGMAIAGQRRIDNLAAFALQALPVRLELRALADGSLLQVRQWQVNVAPSGQDLLPFDFNSSGLPLGGYVLVLLAELVDGNGQAQWTTLDEQGLTLVDLSPPLLSMLAPAENALSRDSVLVLASASDLLDRVDLVEVSVDGGPWLPLASQPGQPGHYERQLDGLAEGPHTLQLRARDPSGNSTLAPPVPRPITVDLTPPQITITGVSDGQLSNQPVRPLIEVTDLHPGPTQIWLDGAPFTSGTEISADGTYVLMVQASDAVGNSSSASLQFTLDLTPPLVTIFEPADGLEVLPIHLPLVAETEAGIEVQLLNGVQPNVLISDSNGRVRFPAVTLHLGENLLQVRARDRAGNIGPVASVRVRRLGLDDTAVTASFVHPVSILHGELFTATLRLRTTLPVEPKVDHFRLQMRDSLGAVFETHEHSTSLQPNVDYDWPLQLATTSWPAGRIELALHWRRGPEGSLPWTPIAYSSVVLRDEEAPQIVLLSPTLGASVPHPIPVRVAVQDALSAIGTVEARVDQEPWLPMLPAAEPGQWRIDLPALEAGSRSIGIRAEDAAGNQATLGPIPICRSDAAWAGFADGFEAAVGGSSLGFEKDACTAMPQTLKTWVERWFDPARTGSGPTQTEAAKEASHAPR